MRTVSFRHSFLTILLLATLWLLNSACSSERNNPIAKTFHNTTAHYNAYYIAREKLAEAEYTIEQNRRDNYNEILDVYQPMTEELAALLTSLSEEAIKKASLPIQYHKNSKWVDDAYILIGRSRFYKADFANAIQTFKYVNNKSEDEKAKNLALSWLLRSFLESGELNNARAVSDYLKKQALDKKVVAPVTLARADYFLELKEYQEAAENLDVAVKYTKPKRKRARLHFILAQIYQELGQNEKAFEHYQLTLKSNPNYDLSFYAKLYMAQVTKFSSETDIKEIKKYFQKLLKDPNNEEYKDKIYYELAKFELKQENIDKTIDYLVKSIKSSTTNKDQKAYSYLMMAEVQYDQIKDYEISKAYYDSTLQTLNEDHEDYESIKKRHEVLEAFTNQLAIIHYEDSVQKLAALDSVDLINKIDELYEQELERKRLAEKEAERNKVRNELNFGDDSGFSTGGDGESWYFSNLSALSIGQTEFTRLWGRRALEDNWRRSNKGVDFQEQEEEVQEEDLLADEEIEGLNEEDFKNKDEYNKAVNRTKMLASLPLTPEKIKLSNEKLEIAYYKLGKIYFLNLEEFENATETFEVLLERFPETENKLEVMYFLYVLNKDSNPEYASKYSDILLKQYANSLYAKLILNPDYLKDAKLEDQVAGELYQLAFENYKNGLYPLALQQLNKILSEYPSSTFIDKALLLKIMVQGKSKDLITYKSNLESFIKEYNTSEVLPFAQKLLDEANAYIEAAIVPDQISEATGAKQESTPYEFQAGDRHFFILKISGEDINASETLIELSDFNKKNFENSNLQVSQLLINDKDILFMVKDFKNSETGIAYFQKFQGKNELMNKYKSSAPEVFIIGSKNFPLLYKSKDIREYKSFFRKNYL